MGHVIISSHPWTMGLENITCIKKILIISAYVLLVTNWAYTWFNNRRIILWIECLRTRCVSNGTASLINKCRNQWSYCVPLSFPFLLPIVSTKYGGSSQEGTKYLTFTTCTWATLLPAYCKCAHGYIEPRFSSSCVFSFGSFAISRYSD